MIRFPALCLAGCVVCAGLILSNDSPSFEARLPPPKTELAAPDIRKLADLLNPIRPHPSAMSSADDANSRLSDVRLTGIVIGPDLRIAIFAVSGTNSLVLSEGETLRDWRVQRISPEKVSLSGPAGTIKLGLKPDANLVRPPPPIAVRPGELGPGVAPAEVAGTPGQPTIMTPIPVGNLSATVPVQAQGYPYYFPENYVGYEQDFPPSSYYPYQFPFFAYAVPIRFAFRNIVTVKKAERHRAFHGGAFHGGAFRGGRHR